jgi:hypothetical protein
MKLKVCAGRVNEADRRGRHDGHDRPATGSRTRPASRTLRNIAEALHQQIRSGELKPGDQLPDRRRARRRATPSPSGTLIARCGFSRPRALSRGPRQAGSCIFTRPNARGVRAVTDVTDSRQLKRPFVRSAQVSMAKAGRPFVEVGGSERVIGCGPAPRQDGNTSRDRLPP